MFVDAIETASKFTTGIHTIDRTYGKTFARPGAATMFFVNDEGVAITCKHVAELIPASGDIQKRFSEFKSAKNTLKQDSGINKKVKELAKQYGFDEKTICELLIQIQGVGSWDSFQIHFHPKYDLAIIQFVNLTTAKRPFAKFLKNGDSLKQGKMLCRLGFPFPEFTNFEYNADSDAIGWTTTGVTSTPCFPIEGMITRFLANEGEVFGIELSTPGLKGQSGGPLFDKEGVVCGMQSATNHLHLGFDMKNQEIISNGEKVKVSNQPFLHVGHCIHVNIIKSFLTEKGIKFQVAE